MRIRGFSGTILQFVATKTRFTHQWLLLSAWVDIKCVKCIHVQVTSKGCVINKSIIFVNKIGPCVPLTGNCRWQCHISPGGMAQRCERVGISLTTTTPHTSCPQLSVIVSQVHNHRNQQSTYPQHGPGPQSPMHLLEQFLRAERSVPTISLMCFVGIGSRFWKWTAINAVVIRIKWQFYQNPAV